jgi:hypothetical protein
MMSCFEAKHSISVFKEESAGAIFHKVAPAGF